MHMILLCLLAYCGWAQRVKSGVKEIRLHLVTKIFSKNWTCAALLPTIYPHISMTSSLTRGNYITLQGQCRTVPDCKGKWKKKGNDGLMDGRIKWWMDRWRSRDRAPYLSLYYYWPKYSLLLRSPLFRLSWAKPALVWFESTCTYMLACAETFITYPFLSALSLLLSLSLSLSFSFSLSRSRPLRRLRSRSLLRLLRRLWLRLLLRPWLPRRLRLPLLLRDRRWREWDLEESKGDETVCSWQATDNTTNLKSFWINKKRDVCIYNWDLLLRLVTNVIAVLNSCSKS